MKSLDDWYRQQHEEDRFNLAPLMDRMHEALHIVDREQERMSARVRQNTVDEGLRSSASDTTTKPL